MKISIYSLLLLCFCFGTTFAQQPAADQQPDDVQSMVRTRTTSTRLTSTPEEFDPFFALRAGRVIFVESHSLTVGATVIEEKLQKRPEFKQLGLVITRDHRDADIILEVHHDVFTKFVYTAIDPRTNYLLASGKLSSLGGTVAGKVAEKFLKQVAQARLNSPGR